MVCLAGRLRLAALQEANFKPAQNRLDTGQPRRHKKQALAGQGRELFEAQERCLQAQQEAANERSRAEEVGGSGRGGLHPLACFLLGRLSFAVQRITHAPLTAAFSTHQ
jgi:hypothetical protein